MYGGKYVDYVIDYIFQHILYFTIFSIVLYLYFNLIILNDHFKLFLSQCAAKHCSKTDLEMIESRMAYHLTENVKTVLDFTNTSYV